MNFKETVDYLYSALPFFQRDGAGAITKDLNNTRLICNFLDRPQQKFLSVHVAGTNGKGSVSHYLASVLHEAGYRVGLYTSPHLKRFTERIKVNGTEIDEEFVVDFTQKLIPIINDVKPSFFEITVGMAFDYFARRQVDIAIIETGMGGRLDSTNVIEPILSVITNISYDHKDFLGNTLEEIAGEKAGIIKAGVPVVIGERHPQTAPVFTSKALSLNSAITFADDEYRTDFGTQANLCSIFRNGKLLYENFDPGLYGIYQLKNISTVLKALDWLRVSDFNVSDHNILDGLKNVVANTGLKGRWQQLATSPLTVCDTGHNEGGIAMVAEMLSKLNRPLHMVLGMMKDKDRTAIFKLLPRQAHYYFCKPSNNPRAAEPELLAEEAKKYFDHVNIFIGTGVNETLAHARKCALETDVIFIGGSTFVVAELDEL